MTSAKLLGGGTKSVSGAEAVGGCGGGDVTSTSSNVDAAVPGAEAVGGGGSIISTLSNVDAAVSDAEAVGGGGAS